MNIEEEILTIKERNKRVEKDKAWERSGLRIVSVCVLTYVVVVITLFIIGIKNHVIKCLKIV